MRDDIRVVEPPLLEERQVLLEEGFPTLDVGLLAVPPAATSKMALRRRLTAYDASYLWLAMELGASLLTLDSALMRAWKRHRI
jgi:predicted nucleic acid-binding protein